LAFLAVALGALALLSGLVLVAAERDVSDLVREEQDQTVTAVGDAVTAAYAEAGAWDTADLRPALAIATEGDANATVLDHTGRAVTSAGGLTKGGRTEIRRIEVGGQRVGTVRVVFETAGLPSPAADLRDALVATVVAGAGLAALLALGVAVVVSRHITRPVSALTATVRVMGRGDRSARVGTINAPGELGELATAFDRMADAVDREDRLRRALVADVAHELRTPVAILRATIEGIADGVVEPTPSQMASLHDDVLRLGRIVDDLETLAAAEAAVLSLTWAPVDLAEVARRAVAQLEKQFEATGIDVETDLVTVVIDGDADRLHQVVTNLLTNALKFTPAPGAVRLEVGPDGEAARLAVIDTGVGIPSAELPHVFDRFWRGRHGATTSGSGIGLAVVAELVRAHHGLLSVDSEVGRGTTISITLPHV
jgi:two-component system sensor histidine kinase BaeS